MHHKKVGPAAGPLGATTIKLDERTQAPPAAPQRPAEERAPASERETTHEHEPSLTPAPASQPLSPATPTAPTRRAAGPFSWKRLATAGRTTRDDRLQGFRPLLPGIRWGTLAVGLAIAALRGQVDLPFLGWSAALLLHAVWRTFRPLRYTDDRFWSLAPVLFDLGLSLLAVVSTGYWSSPLAFCVLTPVVAAGFARGYAFALRSASAAVVCVGLPYVVRFRRAGDFDLTGTGQWSVEVLLVAIVAGYVFSVFGEAQARHHLALDRMNRLAEANDLLFSLHRVAQTLPASLHLDDVLASTLAHLRELVAFDVAAILMRDEASATWQLVAGEGVRMDRLVPDAELPAALRLAVTQTGSHRVCDLTQPGEGPGLGVFARSGMYAPLRARDGLVGLIAIEHQGVDHFGRREQSLLDGFVEPAALAIDNARWFGRLRNMGAEEERSRIARDIHDRVGQALAYLAFELDRITKRSETALVHEDLGRLRTEVRGVVTEVRETLYDLRTEVTPDRGLANTLEQFLRRVADRAHLDVALHNLSDGRLPMLQERELWRIAQEAVANVERHAQASHLIVRWECDGQRALLTVTDDGCGFEPGAAGRLDSYGMIGMRERADAIGARLEMDSAPGEGTTIRCRLDP